MPKSNRKSASKLQSLSVSKQNSTENAVVKGKPSMNYALANRLKYDEILSKINGDNFLTVILNLNAH